MITLSKTHLTEIQNHGTEAYPEECCGAMLGRDKTVHKIVRIENQSSENKHRRFSITPQDYMALEKLAKKEGLNLLGFYHTHPDHPARPSETDLKFAWPVFSYIILSIQKGVPGEFNSFVLDEEAQAFLPEKISSLD